MLYSFVRPAIEFNSKAVSPNHRSIGNGIKWVECEIQYQMNSEIDTIEPANKSTLRNETNGDDNYAIISFILVDTKSLSATHPCRHKRYSATAMHTHTRCIPNCLLNHIAVAHNHHQHQHLVYIVIMLLCTLVGDSTKSCTRQTLSLPWSLSCRKS